jgi:general secretion pathway protein D
LAAPTPPPPAEGVGGTPVGEDDTGLFACRKAKGKFKINFKPETELKDLVTWAFTFTCKNFIYDSKISARASKVTLMAPGEVSAQEAWRIFLVALQSMGLTIVPKGNVLEIVDHAQAKTSPLPLFMKAMPANSDQMVRAVLRPEYLPVDELVKVLTELKSKNGDVKPIPKAGAVLVTDFGTHVAKMASLMMAVDQPLVNERLYLIRVHHGDAVEMQQKLEEILGLKGAAEQGGTAPGFGGSSRARNRAGSPMSNVTVTAPGGEPGGEDGVESAVPSKIVADERTNSLILLGGEAAYQRIRALVRRLDVPIGPEGKAASMSIVSNTRAPKSSRRR